MDQAAAARRSYGETPPDPDQPAPGLPCAILKDGRLCIQFGRKAQRERARLSLIGKSNCSIWKSNWLSAHAVSAATSMVTTFCLSTQGRAFVPNRFDSVGRGRLIHPSLPAIGDQSEIA
jgi:hypothetical protein